MIGRSIGRFHVTERLGQGGMGVVELARDTRLKQLVELGLAHDHAALGEPRLDVQHRAK